MQLMVDMKPGFLRYPGGNYLEGNSLAERWAWKTTLGPLEDRAGHGNSAWRYRASDGMGMLEFLEWCEDMNAEPVLAVYDGLSLRQSYVASAEELPQFVQEALDAIEYVTGDASTKWGAQRAKDGHPKPFKLTYVEVGNEEALGGATPTSYVPRFEAFYDAIKAKYPNLQIISSMAGTARNLSALTRKPDVVDDHYYMSIQQSLTRAHIYDDYDRSGPKIFVGEWATRVPTTGDTCSMAEGAADAAFLTGLERNADVVVMNCYAPLFVNVNPGGRQWAVDLIGYDTLTSFGSPSYYVQKMFSRNRGDVVLPVQLGSAPTTQVATPQGRGRGAATAPAAAPVMTTVDQFFATASRDNASGDVILKLVNMQDGPQAVNIDLQGVSSVASQAKVEVLSGDPAAVNTIAEPTKIAPRQITISNAAARFSHELPANSVSVIRLKTK
jgi:alpha-N-arabinofuranosidase